MSNPLVVLLSQCPQLVRELPPLLQEMCEVRVCRSLEEAAQLVKQESPRALIADFRSTVGGGHFEDRFLETIHECLPELSVAVLTPDPCPEPLERRVACDRLVHFREPVDLSRLVEWRQSLIGPVDLSVGEGTHPGNNPQNQSKEQVKRSPENVIGTYGICQEFETNTPRLRRMLGDLEIAAGHNVTILLIGETGSGKTYLSQLVHRYSPRRDAPFLHVACGALPNDLIESELFGHAKGAFTSAHADKEGKFLAAGRGTILLDEIDVLGSEQQVKLLRVIETGEFEPVGSNQTFQSQARLVVASNLDLQPLVEQGKFRPDLYYRLNMLKFEIPPLRERKPDIVPLAKKFVERLSAKHGVAIVRIDESLFGRLLDYPWPGNVRELENVIQRAVIYCRDGVLRADHLPPHILEGVTGPTNDPSVSLSGTMGSGQKLDRQIAMTEKDIIEQALFKNNFSRTNTAKALGISRVTLYNKMKKYGMKK